MKTIRKDLKDETEEGTIRQTLWESNTNKSKKELKLNTNQDFFFFFTKKRTKITYARYRHLKLHKTRLEIERV